MLGATPNVFKILLTSAGTVSFDPVRLLHATHVKCHHGRHRRRPPSPTTAKFCNAATADTATSTAAACNNNDDFHDDYE